MLMSPPTKANNLFLSFLPRSLPGIRLQTDMASVRATLDGGEFIKVAGSFGRPQSYVEFAFFCYHQLPMSDVPLCSKSLMKRMFLHIPYFLK